MAEQPSVEGAALQPKDAQARAATLRLLRLLAAAALILPLSLFLFASWISYRDRQALTEERITRSLDVMQEQALKAFQSITVALDAIDRLLDGRSPAEIAAAEPHLHAELDRIEQTLPDVQSIWVFGPDGHPQVITRQSPPPALYYGDQDYFTVPRHHPDALYVGHVHQSVSGGEPYFTIDRARRDGHGDFAGVIEMSLLPSRFTRFYSHLLSGPGLGFSMRLEDGTILARFPPLPHEVPHEVRRELQRQLAANAPGGLYDAVSPIDHTEHRVGLRRLPGFPVYVSAFVPVSAVRTEWIAGMAVHLIFGLPATILLFVTVLVVSRRTQRLYAETDQRLAAEAALRQAQRLEAVGHLTGGVAHDFNNLLTIILGNLGAAKSQLGQWSDAAHAQVSRRVDSALHGATRASTLTKRLLAFARQTPLRPAAIDVNRLLAGLSDFLHRALGEDVALEIVGAAGLWPGEADAAELEAALLNLAVNARDAMPDGGRLQLRSANVTAAECERFHAKGMPAADYVLVEVTDTGSGIPESIRDKIFVPFFTTKEVGKGTGLGLSTVYGIIKQTGGFVYFDSEQGKGTTFRIFLPRHMASAREAAAGSAHAESPAIAGLPDAAERVRRAASADLTGEGTILLVEDEEGLRALNARGLASRGYTVLQAGNGVEAIDVLEKSDGKVDLVVSDVVMPEMDGPTLLRELRRRNPELKIIFVSGYAEDAFQKHLPADGQQFDFLAKPFTLKQLVAKVKETMVA